MDGSQIRQANLGVCSTASGVDLSTLTFWISSAPFEGKVQPLGAGFKGSKQVVGPDLLLFLRVLLFSPFGFKGALSLLFSPGDSSRWKKPLLRSLRETRI